MKAGIAKLLMTHAPCCEMDCEQNGCYLKRCA